MYTVTILQQGTPVKTVTITAPDALAAIGLVEQDYPAETVVLNGRRFVWRGVDFMARRISN